MTPRQSHQRDTTGTVAGRCHARRRILQYGTGGHGDKADCGSERRGTCASDDSILEYVRFQSRIPGQVGFHVGGFGLVNAVRKVPVMQFTGTGGVGRAS
jgi:hypothetical protein